MGKGIEKLQALDVCEKLIGERPDNVTYPGGRSRESVRLHFGDQTRILTRRPDSDKARREARILRALHENGGPVPEIFAFDGLWMVQEDLGNRRLSFVYTSYGMDAAGFVRQKNCCAIICESNAASNRLVFQEAELCTCACVRVLMLCLLL